MAEHIASEPILTAAEIAAVAVGWRMAHDESCRLRELCSAHQPVSAAAQRPRVVEALLSDWHFLALKDRADWTATTNPAAAAARAELTAAASKPKCHCGGVLSRWSGTDGHNGVEWFSTCDRCGRTT